MKLERIHNTLEAQPQHISLESSGEPRKISLGGNEVRRLQFDGVVFQPWLRVCIRVLNPESSRFSRVRCSNVDCVKCSHGSNAKHVMAAKKLHNPEPPND